MKKALFFGGALLVLAACGDSTAPTSPSALREVEGNPAALTAGPPGTGAPKAKKLPLPNTLSCMEILIRPGVDGTTIIETVCPTDLQ